MQRVNLYDFDANGNQTLVAVNAVEDSACLADTAGMEVRQLLWDEENRLLSINDNGYVSNYFYDANGERTVKLSQPDMAVFVNGASALKNDSSLMKFVGYVSPYLVVSNGGRYTKHIYAGTQRIASKLGDIEAFGADPRRVEKAGADIREIDFGKKYAQQNDSLSSRYDQLGAMNKPEINDDYVGGQSFCCGDKPLADMPQNAGNSENAQFEENIYFYHPDHLGSTSMVTNIDGEITQNVVYIPYGEVFVEERNGAWSSPYLFNAKELDEETGLYYYGARYLDPTSTRWLSVDPMWEKYMGMTPYGYCAGNPIRYIDPNGREKVIALDRENDRNLCRAADSYSSNQGVVHFWGHGIKNAQGRNWAVQIDGRTIPYKDGGPERFHQYLMTESSVYSSNNSTDNASNNASNNNAGNTSKTTLLVMHSCKTGQEDGFAQNISKELNVLVVAPTENVSVQTVTPVGSDPISTEKGVLNNGRWNIYYKGELMDSFNGDRKPIFRNPIQTIEKYERMWQERHEERTNEPN